MTSHDLVAFLYHNGPCTHVDLDFEFGCGVRAVTLMTFGLIIDGILDYDIQSGLFSYAGNLWEA